ncbi:hypothetical protein ACOME3_002144 [Neoechinorhynchus agilis]
MPRRRARRRNYKKLKRVDPYYNGMRKMSKKERDLNRPPKRSDKSIISNDRATDHNARSSMKPDVEGAITPLNEIPLEPRQKSESIGEYLRRIDEETKYVVLRAKATVRSSRNDPVRAHASKKKKKVNVEERKKSGKTKRKVHETNIQEDVYEKIQFGDVVHAPPFLTSEFKTKKPLRGENKKKFLFTKLFEQ